MPHAGSFHPQVKTDAHFALVASVQLAAQERGDLAGLDGVNGRADDVVFNCLQGRLAAKCKAVATSTSSRLPA